MLNAFCGNTGGSGEMGVETKIKKLGEVKESFYFVFVEMNVVLISEFLLGKR